MQDARQPHHVQESFTVNSASDVTRLINAHGKSNNYSRMIILLALGGIFLDAYDLTSLSYGINDVIKEFSLTPIITGIVTSSITIGMILGNCIGGWMTDKYGRYSVFMADMLFFVVSAIAAGLAPNVWVLIGARFLMGIGIGIDLPVAMAYLAEFSKFKGKDNKSARLATWCPVWYAASSICFLIVFGFYLILPQEYEGWIWRAALMFGAVPALVIVAVRSRFMNESPQWAANQGNLEEAARILRDAYGINATVGNTYSPEPAPAQKKHNKVDLKALLRPPYRQRTIVAGLLNMFASFQYTSITFFLPTILHSLGANTFQTITGSLGLNLLFAFTGGLLGIHLAWKYPMRYVILVGLVVQFLTLVALALLGHPEAIWGIMLATLMLGLWLFAQGFGPGAQMMSYPALAFPTAIRASGIGFTRACASVGGSISLFILPTLNQAFGTNMFWIIAIAPVVPILALLIVRYEPTHADVDIESEQQGA